MDLSTGQRTMLPLNLPLVCTPAEDLCPSQARSFSAKKSFAWRVGSWNVRSLLDADGPVEVARQGRDALQAEDRRVDLVVREVDR